ncbi:MAG: NAD-dependent DNA ligase LigA [Candidatus Saelkia tenebricola]|nr:NAD-dependent DNA ligase LigA [Candidatus Saelkia tenebricola]
MSKDLKNVKSKIESLRDEIRRHNHQYFVENMPRISDQAYDISYKRLEELECKFPKFKTVDSPTQRVGGMPLDRFKTVKHNVPMLSMDNTYSEDEIRDFNRRVEKNLNSRDIDYLVELKIDGLSVSLQYRDGVFTQGATRGDGYRGDEVTRNLKTIRSIPLKLFTKGKLKFPKLLEMRGEVYLPQAVFSNLNKEREKNGEAIFANPRNAAAGSLKLLDSRQVLKRNLDIFIWGVGYCEGIAFKTHRDVLTYFKDIGLKVNPHYKFCQGIEDVIQYCREWRDKKKTLDYDIDGIVVKVNSLKQQERLGATSKSPRWLIAYKFPSLRTETVLKEIIIQVGRFGTLTPVAVVEPVSITGSVVTRASLHNEDQIKRMGVKIGDTVLIEKAGEIIPQVVEVIKDKRSGGEKAFKMPKSCPVCGGKVARLDSEVAIRCLNQFCPAQIKNAVKQFASRDAMNIEGIGEALVEQLIDEKLIKDYADLYFLRNEQLQKLERMGVQSSANILEAIEMSKNPPLHCLIYALGIRHVGVHTAEILADEFLSIKELSKAGSQELSVIEGVGPIVAESVISFFSSCYGKKVIEKLEKAGLNMGKKSRKTSDLLTGLKFVVTGTLKGYSRGEIEEIIKKYGGKISSSVSSRTDFLILGRDTGAKYKKAKEQNVKIIKEEDFNKMIKSIPPGGKK